MKKIVDGLRLDEDPPAGQPRRFSENDDAVYAIRFQQHPTGGGTNDVRYGDPFTGDGFTSSTADSNRIIPEFYANKTGMKSGAEMWRINSEGQQELVGVLQGKTWISVEGS
ncbi:hypothetical protein [Spelaeicoccus albus]|uniref:Uncharacterized protein n=1 Tax=Spelaeicoccus albus TaxID=1280376 RepID=A0A7Z0AAV9_9MICO|nr:hypothetical protein [Spelaeicoccus albus]